MDKKCRLCLVSKNEIIEFFGDKGIKLKIVQILVQHFWFQIRQNDNFPIGICRKCWKYVNDFHGFYKNIELIHKNHYDNIQFKNDYNTSKIKTEITEFNIDSTSLNHSNIELIAPIVEVKMANKKIASNVKIIKKVEIKSTCDKTSKFPTKSPNANTIKIDNCAKTITNDHSTKSKSIDNVKQMLNKKLTNDHKIGEHLQQDQQQSVEGNRITVTDDIVNDDIMEVKQEFVVSNDNILHTNDFTENQIGEKNENMDNHSEKTIEDIQISEFYNLKCEICSSQHSTLFELKKHYVEAHKIKSGYVICCNKKLFRRCTLLEHILWHTNPDEFTCKVCNQIYANKYCLKNHMHFHSKPEERKYICDICNASFTVRYHLMRHFLKTHLTQINKEFKCHQCDKTFNQNSVLQSHIRGVHEFKYVNICQICAKVYKSKQQCEKHYLDEHINANKPKLQCNLCGSMLKNEISLKCHMRRKHLAEPSECKLCGKITSNKLSLQNHMRYVHAERKFKCNLCDKAFKKPIRLKEHMATHTGNSILYTCPYCTTSFNSLGNMYSHRKRKHPVEWSEERQLRLGIIATK